MIHEPPLAAQRAKARPDAAEQGEDGQPAHPGLDAEPAARDHRAKHRRDVRAAQAEGGAGEDRERDAVARAGMRVDDHRHEHDRVADDDRQQARPPAQAGADHRRGEHVARDAHAHPDPERRDVPEIPGALGRRASARGRRCSGPSPSRSPGRRRALDGAGQDAPHHHAGQVAPVGARRVDVGGGIGIEPAGGIGRGARSRRRPAARR